MRSKKIKLEKKNIISVKRLGHIKTKILGLSDTYDLEDGSVVPVDKSELPVLLPEDIDLNSQGNPLDNHLDWKTPLIKNLVKKQLERQIL